MTPTTTHPHTDLSQGTVVSAGAGAGKTTFLVDRIIQLLADHPDWELGSIVGITFTQKAADQIASRLIDASQDADESVRQRIVAGIQLARLTTIHGFCVGILRQYPIHAGLVVDFDILPEDLAAQHWDRAMDFGIRTLLDQDSDLLLSYCQTFSVRQLRLDLKACFAQRETLVPQIRQILASRSGPEYVTTLVTLFSVCEKHYHRLNQSINAVDFVDLLRLTRQLLKIDSVRTQVQAEIHAMVVDEFQDTNQLQWEIIQATTSERPFPQNDKILVVGDVHQSIYRFRGAQPDLFQSLSQDEAVNQVKIQNNYRSTQDLLDRLNKLFSQLLPHFSPLVSNRTEHPVLDPVKTSFLEDDSPQPRLVATHLWAYKTETDAEWSDMAVLFRTKKQLAHYAHELSQAGIQVVVRSGAGFYQCQEVIDGINLATALADPTHLLAWQAVLNSPMMGFSLAKANQVVGPVSKQTILERVSTLTPSDWHQDDWDNLQKLSGWVNRAVTESLADVMFEVLDETQTWQTLSRQSRGDQAVANLTKLCHQIQDWERDHDRLSLVERLRRAATQTFGEPEAERVHDVPAVSLMTIHAAKGLEFGLVVLPELQTGFRLPSRDRVLVDPDRGLGIAPPQGQEADPIREAILESETEAQLAEEDRLFYVAATRAKNQLVLVGQVPPSRSSMMTRLLEYLNRLDGETEWPGGFRVPNITTVSTPGTPLS